VANASPIAKVIPANSVVIGYLPRGRIAANIAKLPELVKKD
jgi:hypothetical protein